MLVRPCSVMVTGEMTNANEETDCARMIQGWAVPAGLQTQPVLNGESENRIDKEISYKLTKKNNHVESPMYESRHLAFS